MTIAEKLRHWQVFIKRHIKYENKLFRKFKNLFREQERIVLDNLRKQIDSEIGLESDKILDFESQGIKQFNIETILFNEKDEIERFLDGITSNFMGIVEDSGNLALDNLGLEISFDILDPNVVNFINNESFQTIRGITRTTADNLRNTLREGIIQGEAPQDLTKRIQKVFKGTVRGTAARSRLISRTEVTKFFNFGTVEGWKKSGIVSTKMWYTAKDERVRPTHVEVNEQEVLTSGEFTVGGMQMKHPGDPAGGAKEVCNCRCTLIASQIKT